MSIYQEYLKDLHEKLLHSGTYLGIFSDDFKENPKCLIEIGMAVMLDKPIYLFVPVGTSIPENMKRLARGIEYYTSEEDIPFLVERLKERTEEEPSP